MYILNHARLSPPLCFQTWKCDKASVTSLGPESITFLHTNTLYIHRWKYASACKLYKHHPAHLLYNIKSPTLLIHHFSFHHAEDFLDNRHKVFCKWGTSGIRWKPLNNWFLLSFCSSFFPLALLPCHSFLKVRRRTEEQLNPKAVIHDVHCTLKLLTTRTNHVDFLPWQGTREVCQRRMIFLQRDPCPRQLYYQT